MSNYGDFSSNGDEYIVNRQDTPVDWHHYLANPTLLASFSQTGDGVSYIKDKSGEIWPLLGGARHSRTVYIRDLDSNEYWSVNWLPTKHASDYHEARFGLGYVQLSSSYQTIDSSLTFILDPKEPVEIWRLKLGNGGTGKRRLAVFVVSQWPEQTELNQSNYFYKGSVINQEINSPTADPITRFITSTTDIQDYDSLETAFYGSYRGEHEPVAVSKGKPTKSEGDGQAGVGVLSKQVVLGSKETVELTFLVGALPSIADTSKEKVHQAISKVGQAYQKTSSVTELVEKTAHDYKTIFEQWRCATPEKELDRYQHFFGQYQAYLRGLWPTSGEQNALTMYQAITSVAAKNSDQAEALLFSLLSKQLKEGRLANSWLGQTEQITSDQNCEDSLYAALAINALLIETGDYDLLKTPIPYLDGGEGSVLEHLVKLVEFAISRRSSHGWVEQAVLESSALTFLLRHTLLELLPLFSHQQDVHLVKKYEKIATEIAAIADNHWQSPWYSRGKTASGRINSSSGTHSFDLATQGLAMESGVPSSERLKQLVAKLAKQSAALPPLNFTSAYHHYDETAPNYSSSAPGTGLNSSVEIATVLPVIKGAFAAKEPEVAWRWISQILPNYAAGNAERYQAEPFWLATSLDGPDSHAPGRARTQFTNSAGALEKIIFEQLFGVRPTHQGLVISPCIPKNWRNLEFSRRFRGADYQFRIENPFRVSSGIERIIVDGIRLSGTTIRPFAGGLHFVEIVLG